MLYFHVSSIFNFYKTHYFIVLMGFIKIENRRARFINLKMPVKKVFDKSIMAHEFISFKK